jgi:nitroreductase
MTQNQSESIFFRRQSKRAYRPTPVPAEALQRILEKTRWAPSCANRQSWQFVIVQDPAGLARWVGCEMPYAASLGVLRVRTIS